jgi:uncharacterized protein (DUF1501 family)
VNKGEQLEGVGAQRLGAGEVRFWGGRGCGRGVVDVALGAAAVVWMVVGSALAGGRVRADWPGLGSGKLFENRDLAPTVDVRAVAQGLRAAHLGLGQVALVPLFPDSAAATPMGGLSRA